MGAPTRSGYGSGNEPADPAGDGSGPRAARTVFGREIHRPPLRPDTTATTVPEHVPAPPVLPTLTPVPATTEPVPVAPPRRPAATPLSGSELDALGGSSRLRSLLIVLAAAAVSFTVVALISWQRGRQAVPPPAPAVVKPVEPRAPEPAAPTAAPPPVPTPAPRKKPRAPRDVPPDPDAPMPFRL